MYDVPIVKEECKPRSQKNGYCIEKSHQAEKVRGYHKLHGAVALVIAAFSSATETGN